MVGHEATCNAMKARAAECARGELTLPMLVTESGIVTLVRLVQKEKAYCESQRVRARACRPSG